MTDVLKQTNADLNLVCPSETPGDGTNSSVPVSPSHPATDEIQRTLNLLTRECSALSEESRNGLSLLQSSLHVLEKKQSYQSKVWAIGVLLFSIVISACLSAAVTMWVSNRMDAELFAKKVDQAGGFFSSSGPSYPEKVFEQINLGDSLVTSATTQSDPEITFTSLGLDERLTNLAATVVKPDGRYTLKLARNAFLKARGLADASVQDERDIDKHLFAVNFLLHDFKSAEIALKSLRKLGPEISPLSGLELEAINFRAALLHYAMGNYSVALQDLWQMETKDEQNYGAHGGPLTSAMHKLHVRCLIALKNAGTAHEYIARVSKRMQPFPSEADTLVHELTVMVPAKDVIEANDSLLRSR